RPAGIALRIDAALSAVRLDCGGRHRRRSGDVRADTADQAADGRRELAAAIVSMLRRGDHSRVVLSTKDTEDAKAERLEPAVLNSQRWHARRGAAKRRCQARKQPLCPLC